LLGWDFRVFDQPISRKSADRPDGIRVFQGKTSHRRQPAPNIDSVNEDGYPDAGMNQPHGKANWAEIHMTENSDSWPCQNSFSDSRTGDSPTRAVRRPTPRAMPAIIPVAQSGQFPNGCYTQTVWFGQLLKGLIQEHLDATDTTPGALHNG